MWLEPKTDWQVSYDADGNYTGDYFNIEDYNRIKNNIEYLKELALSLYLPFPFVDLGDDKSGYADLPYAYEFAAMEDNLENIKNGTYLFYHTNKKYWGNNMHTPNYDDFNRLENACLKLYIGLNKQKEFKDRLSLRLGKKKGAIK